MFALPRKDGQAMATRSSCGVSSGSEVSMLLPSTLAPDEPQSSGHRLATRSLTPRKAVVLTLSASAPPPRPWQ